MFGRILLSIILLFVAGAAVITLLVIEPAPAITKTSPHQVDNAETVQELLQQLRNSLHDRHSQQRVEVTEKQLESLMGFAQRAIPGFSGSVTVSSRKTELAASVPLPGLLDSYYINLSTLVFPGTGVDIEYIKIGKISIPGDTALKVSVWLVDRLTQSDVASTAASQITQITMAEDLLVLDMRPLDDLLKQLHVVRDNMASGVTEIGLLTTDYLAFLATSELGQSPSPKSLASYLNLALARAAELSEEGDRVLHNQAALLSLAIYLGDHRFARIAGVEQPVEGEIARPRAPAVLAQRNDLALHFIISAALQIVSQQNITLAIGEFKELMDRALGGSGYSFVDLAADMSGIAFATTAIADNTAARVQQRATEHLRERDIIPALDDLPEGLSKVEFSRRFKEVDSPAYRQQVALIQQRLDALPLYAP
ncbi:hypothetical protein [Alteromonas gilva]|uniref:Uncharacterized protein n=1 Tax=Alteromonas gilva TaxID=2987522 RepID=A0ABT5L907_9ALTE|nr:hypothetical protein [Alteromonas gilva]MDC8833049.1 hypothetical protein [Alteromonas gilva]